MRRQLGLQDGGYRRPGLLRRPGTREHVWPVARAFVAALDLAGLPPALVPPDFHAGAEVAAHLAALETYWDPTDRPLAYSSDVIGTRMGGDRYYDDNAWIGLGLIQLERLRPGTAGLARARELFAFAVGGWDERPDAPVPGGVFWVEQGRGIGRRNHDRNTVSSAPNAQIGLHLAQLGAVGRREIDAAERMIDWVEKALLEPRTGALFHDKIRGDGSIDAAVWSYNQGSMAGAHALRHRLGRAGALARAEAIARAALDHYATRLPEQPPAFNAILLRNLLMVSAASADASLQSAVAAMLHGYADVALAGRRDRHGLFALRDESPSLLDQSAIVSILALSAWDRADYERLA